MKKLLILLAFVVVGCKEQAQQIVGSTNANVRVELLTIVDGCKVYRITDDRAVYLAKCDKNIVTSTKEGCGKNCSYTTSDMTFNAD